VVIDMKLYSENKNYKLYHGSMLDMLEHIEPNSIDSVVTDPPYELNFMGKGWDNAGVSFQADTWKRCYEVLKPGGYLLAFGGSRTFHRIAVAIEDAGFEIRDTIMWIYGSGFPKSMNIGLAVDKKKGVESMDTGVISSVSRPNSDKSNTLYKHGMVGKEFTVKIAQNEWKGWGTCLKPSFEPIIVARKPLEGTLVDNVLTYGVGGLNIDECRVPMSEDDFNEITNKSSKNPTNNYNYNESKKYSDYKLNIATLPNESGRFPANTILTYDETDFEEVCGGFPQSKGASSQNNYSNGSIYRGQSLQESSTKLEGYREWYNDDGSASRYFYCAKASKKDRNEGLDTFEDKFKPAVEYRPFLKREAESGMTEHNDFLRLGKTKNNHPTVKPTELMQYLIRLVTPNGGTILDPFNGSGSTGKAAMYENRERNKEYKYIGIELTEEYLPIAKARIEYPLTCVLHNDKKEIKVKEQPTTEQNREVNLW
jgi:site-specific DNA-methyltransferase (adenine-specific)